MPNKGSITKKKNSTYHEMRRGLAIVIVFSPIILFAFYVVASYFWRRFSQPDTYFYFNSDGEMAIAGLVMLFVLVLFLRRLRHIVIWRRGLFAELRRVAHIREDYQAETDELVSDEEDLDELDYTVNTSQQAQGR